MKGFDLDYIKEEETFDARRFRYVSLPSQQGHFDRATMAKIEEAAMCCHLRDFQTSLCILGALPMKTLQHPAVVYERSQVYWLDWSLYQSEKVLEEGITWRRDHAPDSAELGIYTLLRMALGRVRAMTRGNLTEGRDALREVRRWLLNVSIDDYTEIQIYCVCIYHHLLHFLGNVTDDFDKEFFAAIPAGAGANGWMRLRRLRECLQKRGRLLEARAVLDQELGHTPDGSEQEKACKSIIEACSNQKDSREPIWWIIGRTKLRLGQIFTARSQVQASNDAFRDARGALQAARAVNHENNTLLLIRLAEINALGKSGSQDPLRAYEEFTQYASVQKDNYINSFALSRACKVALARYEKDKSSSNLRTFWRWYRKAETISLELGDIAYFLIFRLATADIACAEDGNFGAILKWHTDFDVKYPAVHLWRQKTAVRKTNKIIYERLNDEKNVRRTLGEMQYIAADQDNFWDEDGFKKQAIVMAPSNKSDHYEASTPAAFQNRDPDMEWMLEWSTREVTVSTGWKPTAIQFQGGSYRYSSILEEYLCSWIKKDFQAGILTKHDLAGILSSDFIGDTNVDQVTKKFADHNIKKDKSKESAGDFKSEAKKPEGNSISTLEDKVASLTPETLSWRLFGTESAPASEHRWEEAYSTLSGWFLQRSTASEARRHFMLFQIQNRRLSSMIHSANPWAVRALEAERLLALFPKLNAKVQEHLSSNVAHWKRTIASATHVISIKSLTNRPVDMQSSEIAEVIGLYNQSLADNLNTNGPLIRDVYINMEMARVYFPAAAKLDPAAADGLLNAVGRAVQAFEKIRAGWRASTSWDRVEKLLSALEDKFILEMAPTVVAVISQITYNDRRAGRDKLIWDMIQFSKSIGISWLMESNAIDAKEKDADMKAPTTRKDDYVEDKTSAGLDTDQLQTDLQKISQLSGSAVFIDWYNSTCGQADMPKPIIATLSGTDSGPHCTFADITWETVDRITTRFMNLESSDLRNERVTALLYELNPLIAPLATCTKPGQTLVLAPCGNLHRIPLHALHLDGRPLIARNPIVYTSSLPALTQTYRQRQRANSPTPPLPGPPIALLGDPPTQIGITALHATSTKLGTPLSPFLAPALTQSLQSPALRLLHYHGHANFEPDDYTQHCLLLHDRALTLRDVFDLPAGSERERGAAGGYHVTLLGCGTGMSKTVPTNDVMGLVSALLYAGASSVLGTLWPFGDEDAAGWGEGFYGEGFGGGSRGEDGRGDRGEGMLDLARANQKAVLAIREKRPALYHWAPFVLCGWWKMRAPGGG